MARNVAPAATYVTFSTTFATDCEGSPTLSAQPLSVTTPGASKPSGPSRAHAVGVTRLAPASEYRLSLVTALTTGL